MVTELEKAACSFLGADDKLNEITVEDLLWIGSSSLLGDKQYIWAIDTFLRRK